MYEGGGELFLLRRESQNAVQELSGMKYVVARWWEKERRVLDNNVSPPLHIVAQKKSQLPL